MNAAAAVLLAAGFALRVAPVVADDCIDVGKGPFSFQGTLTYRIFPGPPNYQDVRKGDAPEPTYVLALDVPVCGSGDAFLDPKAPFDRIQVSPAGTVQDTPTMLGDLRRLIGRRVVAEGVSAFGAHTGHHHAPLVLLVTRVAAAVEDPTKAYGTAMTTVRGFYLALQAGDGEEAARFVIPGRRVSGPLSASVLASFYGSLVESLNLIEVVAVGPNEYRVRYTYVAPGQRRCNGDATVRTTRVNDMNLIESIRTASGC